MDDRPGPDRLAPAKAESQLVGTLSGRAQQYPVAPHDPAQDADRLEEHAARLQADRELRDALAVDGFSGPAYAVFEEELASYGYQVMTVLVATEYIFARCRQAGLALYSMPIPYDDREDLVQETVAEALRSFKRKGLQEGSWCPERGASLRTFFTGALYQQFANVWRKRLRALPRFPGESLETLPNDIESPDPGPDEIAVQRSEIRRGLAGIEDQKKAIIVGLKAEGYEYEEIAEILGPDVTRRSVEGYLKRHREHISASNDERRHQ